MAVRVRADVEGFRPHPPEHSADDVAVLPSHNDQTLLPLVPRLGCYGTKSVRNGKVGRRHIAGAVSLGFPLFFLNGMLLELPAGTDFRAWSYIATLAVGYLCLLAPGSGCGAC